MFASIFKALGSIPREEGMDSEQVFPFLYILN